MQFFAQLAIISVFLCSNFAKAFENQSTMTQLLFLITSSLKHSTEAILKQPLLLMNANVAAMTVSFSIKKKYIFLCEIFKCKLESKTFYNCSWIISIKTTKN